MRITLPYPPSANRYWRTFRGRSVLSAEAKAYKKQVAAILTAAGWTPAEGPVAYTANIYRPLKSGDLDNRLKVLGDALTGFAWVDDKQVVELHAYRHDDKANPRVEMEIVALADGPPRNSPPPAVMNPCKMCGHEAVAGTAFCAGHGLLVGGGGIIPGRKKNPLKPEPAVQSAYRAAKKMEEAMPKPSRKTGMRVQDGVPDECDCVHVEPFPPPLRGGKVVADQDCMRCKGRATRRRSRGVEGELQPLNVKR